MITVNDLITVLKTLPKTAVVLVDSDQEGNNTMTMYGVSTGFADTSEHGSIDVYSKEDLADNDMKSDDLSECVVILPG